MIGCGAEPSLQMAETNSIQPRRHSVTYQPLVSSICAEVLGFHAGDHWLNSNILLPQTQVPSAPAVAQLQF